MKKLFLLIFFFGLLAVVSCKKQEVPEINTVYDTLKVNIAFIEYGLDAHTVLTLDASTNDATAYYWTQGGQTTPMISVENEGLYSVQISTHAQNYVCQVLVYLSGSDCYVPNSFSPNNDGINDLWKPYFFNISEANFELKIYDSENLKVFETHDKNEAWNGTYNANALPVGYYYYLIKYQTQSGEIKTRNGMIQLIV